MLAEQAVGAVQRRALQGGQYIHLLAYCGKGIDALAPGLHRAAGCSQDAANPAASVRVD